MKPPFEMLNWIWYLKGLLNGHHISWVKKFDAAGERSRWIVKCIILQFKKKISWTASYSYHKPSYYFLQSGEQCLSCNIFYCRQFWILTLCLCHVRLLLGKLIWHSEWHLLVHSEILYLFLRIQIRYTYRRSPQIQPCVLFPHTKKWLWLVR